MTRPAIADQGRAKWLGIALTVAGALVLYDAYERRGGNRPFLLRFLPT